MTEAVLSVDWDDAGVWTPLGAPRTVSTVRGRTRTLDAISAGLCVLTLPNEARQLDPAHNPAVAGIVNGTKMRVQATFSAVTYDLFTGYLERSTQHFGNPDTPKDAEMVYELVDGVGVLAAAGLDTAWAIAARKALPRAWYRLGETTGTVVVDSVGSAYGGFGGTVERTSGLVEGDNDGAAQFEVPYVGYLVAPPEFLPTSTSWSVHFLLQLEAIPLPFGQNLMYDLRAPGGLQMWVDSSGFLNVQVRSPDGSTSLAYARSNVAVAVGPDLVSNVTIVAGAGLTLRIYFGTADVTTGAVGTAHALAPVYTVWGYVATEPMILDELMTFDRALTTAEMFDLGHAAIAWQFQWFDDRLDAILEAVDWDPALRDTATAESENIPGLLHAFESTTALAHLEALRSTIEGRLWVRPNGELTFLGRLAQLGAPYSDVQATFSDSGAGLGYRELGAYVIDWNEMANVVRRYSGESVTTVGDPASVATYGLRDQAEGTEVESLFYSQDQDFDLAQFRLAHLSHPTPYIEGLVVHPRSDDALWPVVLGLDIVDRIIVERTPQGVGSPLELETIVEGIAHDIGPKKWKTTYSIDATYAQRYFLFDDTEWDAPDWRFA